MAPGGTGRWLQCPQVGAGWPASQAGRQPHWRTPDPFRPACDAGVDSPFSTRLKWGADGELTALDLHHVMARLQGRDRQALRMIDAEPGA